MRFEGKLGLDARHLHHEGEPCCRKWRTVSDAKWKGRLGACSRLIRSSGCFDVGLGQVLAGSKFAFRVLCLHSVEGEPRYTVADDSPCPYGDSKGQHVNAGGESELPLCYGSLSFLAQ